MNRIIVWIKANKLTSILLLIVFYFLFQKYISSSLSYQRTYSGGADYSPALGMKVAPQSLDLGMRPDYMLPQQEAAPTSDVSDRLVISESYLSLLVTNVAEAQKQIIQTAQSFGGYMVNSNLNNPQDAPTATVTVRVPSNRLQEALELFRGVAVKVISENLMGEDVTDQYVDNQARLETLEKTKAKFEEILEAATEIQDILQVQREIINLQAEIDAVIGQQKYLEQSAKLARLTVYLSTDELALPYAPSETWRPVVIFRQAVRSLIYQMRKIGTALIWLAVYSVIWIPALLLIYYFKKRKPL